MKDAQKLELGLLWSQSQWHRGWGRGVGAVDVYISRAKREHVNAHVVQA